MSGTQRLPGGQPRKASQRHARRAAPLQRNAMLTEEIISGFNVLSLAGFVVMALTVALSRSGQASKPVSIGVMCIGTALVFYGLYAGRWSR
jgi:hypothetical protein